MERETKRECARESERERVSEGENERESEREKERARERELERESSSYQRKAGLFIPAESWLGLKVDKMVCEGERRSKVIESSEISALHLWCV